jgi:hypothetical protein
MQSLGIRLYLSDKEMARRIDVASLAAYIQALEKQITTTCGPMDLWEADGLLIAVGVQPGGQSRVWCQAVVGHLAQADMDKIAADLMAIIPPAVRHGPIAFAFNIQLLEFDPPEFPIAPREWLAAGTADIPDGVFQAIWPAA